MRVDDVLILCARPNPDVVADVGVLAQALLVGLEVHHVHLVVAAQVECESKSRKRFIIMKFQAHSSGRFQHECNRLNLHRSASSNRIRVGNSRTSASLKRSPAHWVIVCECSKQSGNEWPGHGGGGGALVHYHGQTVRERVKGYGGGCSEFAQVHWYTMTKQSGNECRSQGPPASDVARGAQQFLHLVQAAV